MSTNDNEVDVLFATKRKRQQAEEAQREAQKAEEEKILELERQKKQMLEDIQRLEAEKAQQAAMAENAALAARAAQAEREAQEAKAAEAARLAQEARAAEAARLAQEAQAAKAAQKAQKAAEAEQRAAAKAMAKASAPAQAGGIKKYLPFIIAGAVAVIAIVVVVIVIATSGSKSSDTKTADNDKGDSGKKSSNIENMSDPPEDVYEEGEYDEDYGVYFQNVIGNSQWEYVNDSVSGHGFYYPDCFKVVSASEDGEYEFSYNGNSTQSIMFSFKIEDVGEDKIRQLAGNSHETQNAFGNSVVSATMQGYDVSPDEYEVAALTDPYGQETYYAHTNLDTEGYLFAAFMTWQDGCIIESKFLVSKEAEGHNRFVDFDDLNSLFAQMIKTVVDPNQAKG